VCRGQRGRIGSHGGVVLDGPVGLFDDVGRVPRQQVTEQGPSPIRCWGEYGIRRLVFDIGDEGRKIKVLFFSPRTGGRLARRTRSSSTSIPDASDSPVTSEAGRALMKSLICSLTPAASAMPRLCTMLESWTMCSTCMSLLLAYPSVELKT
jgi:hypothetical protein